MANIDDEIIQQLMTTFKLEADEHLQAINTLLLEMEKGGELDAQALLEDIFREAHSLKGAARAVDLTDIEALSHRLENVFSASKRGELELTSADFDLLYETLDTIGEILSAVAAGGAGNHDCRSLLERLDNVSNRNPDRQDNNGRPEQKTKLKAPKTNGGTAKRRAEETIRVSTKKLDALMIHVEELLVSKIRAEQRLAELKETRELLNDWQKSWLKIRTDHDRMRKQNSENREFAAISDFLALNQSYLKNIWGQINGLMQTSAKDTMRLSLVTEDLQGDIRRVRMLPVATIFNGYTRMIRDLSRETGKQVELVITGSETELDKKVIEGIKDPLMHLLRNAVDHGIEDAATRSAAGKPAQGTISLRASQQGGTILIEVEDDGAGIRADDIKIAAAAKGLIGPEESKTISDEEARFIIFQSGFSTAAKVSSVSGRGVGLDVVKKNIEELNGLVSISAGPSGGTKFSISLPLTLSTSRVLLVRCADQIYAVPTSTVERIARVDRADIFTVGTKEAIDIAGRTLSLVRLTEVLELPKLDADGESKLSVIILGSAEKRVAFAVDALVGETEVVIKSLGRMMPRVRNVSGATILGSGKVVVILNVADLVKSAKVYDRAGAVRATDLPGESEEHKNILVVDDSVTTRILEKNILESAGYNVLLANDGIEALETLRGNPCDLVISDIDMPRMSGLDLTTKVRSDRALHDLPVILVTALDSDRDRERGLEAGADAYFVKNSFDQRSLLDMVEQLI